MKHEVSRKEYLDVLRIVACMMVIYNHTNEWGFFRYSIISSSSLIQFVDFFLAMISKPAVPIFFMISGVTLLNKEESIIHTYKRTLKIIIDILIFSVIYLEIDSFAATGVVRDLKSILIEIVVGSNYWHSWYLFAYVALILTVPFLRDAVK